MESLATHYSRLLGTDDSWRVESVDLRLEDRRFEIRLTHVGSEVTCPGCGRACGLADHADERRGRHLDTMQFTTELVARLPRCRCPEHGVKTIVPPWAGKHSRFTLLFEAFAIEVLQACRHVKAAAAILGRSRDSLQTIMNRAVERGLERREATPIPHLGIAEDDDRLKGTRHFLYRITNATSEGFTSAIQALKYAARGFRSFPNYRTRILFFCGTLDLRPRLRCHY